MTRYLQHTKTFLLLLSSMLVFLSCDTIADNNCWALLSGPGVEPLSVAGTADGGSVVSGQIKVPGGTGEGFVARFDQQGAVQWQKRYASEGDAAINSAGQCADGGYIYSGFWGASFQTTAGDTRKYPAELIMKVNSEGWMQWHRTFAPGFLSMAGQTRDGGYIAVGPGTLMKLGSSGELHWRKEVVDSTTASGSARRMIQTSDGGYVLLSHNVSANPAYENYQTRILKLDSSGAIQWQKSYKNPYQGHLYLDGQRFDASLSMNDIVQTADGGYIATGTVEASPLEQALYGDRDTDLCVMKLDRKGAITWCKTYGRSLYLYGEITDCGIAIIETAGKDYFVLGGSSFSYDVITGYPAYPQWEGESMPVTDSWIWLLKIDSRGELLWAKSYDDDDEFKSTAPRTNHYRDDPVGFAASASNALTLAGMTTSFSQGVWLLLMRVDDRGNIPETSLEIRETRAIVKDYKPIVLNADTIVVDAEYNAGAVMDWHVSVTDVDMRAL